MKAQRNQRGVVNWQLMLIAALLLLVAAAGVYIVYSIPKQRQNAVKDEKLVEAAEALKALREMLPQQRKAAEVTIGKIDLKPIADEHSKRAHFTWRVEFKNDTDRPQDVMFIKIEFFDKGGFKLAESNWIGPSTIAAKSTDAVSDRGAIEAAEWAAVDNYRVTAR